jgi:hypothetical protein
MRRDDSELLASLVSVIETARNEGCPVAEIPRRIAQAETALRRWRSFARRHKCKQSAIEDRIEDLAKGMRDFGEPDRHMVGRLIEDYRYLARELARVLAAAEKTDV